MQVSGIGLIRCLTWWSSDLHSCIKSGLILWKTDELSTAPPILIRSASIYLHAAKNWGELHVKKISRTRNATICSSLRCTSLELQEEVVTRVVKRPPSSLSEFSISDADDYHLDCRERRDRAEMTARGHQKQSVRTMAWSPKNLNISTPHWASYVLVTFEYSHFLFRCLIFNQNSALPLPPTMYIHSIARMYHYPTSENVYKDIVDLLIHK